MQHRNESKQRHWRHFCDDLQTTNDNLQQKVNDLQSSLQHTEQLLSTLKIEYQHFRLSTLEYQNQAAQSDNDRHDDRYRKCVISPKPHPDRGSVSNSKSDHESETMYTITTSSKHRARKSHKHYLTPLAMLEEIDEFENKTDFVSDCDGIEEEEKESSIRFINHCDHNTSPVFMDVDPEEPTDSERNLENVNIPLLVRLFIEHCPWTICFMLIQFIFIIDSASDHQESG